MRALSIALLLALPLAVLAAAPAVPQYTSEDGAQIHCPLDTVVWLNTRNKTWYPKRSKHYANSPQGGFVCLADAKKAGMKRGT